MMTEVTCRVCGDTIVFKEPLSLEDEERLLDGWFVCKECGGI
jgi:hypothetical protein